MTRRCSSQRPSVLGALGLSAALLVVGCSSSGDPAARPGRSTVAPTVASTVTTVTASSPTSTDTSTTAPVPPGSEVTTTGPAGTAAVPPGSLPGSLPGTAPSGTTNSLPESVPESVPGLPTTTLAPIPAEAHTAAKSIIAALQGELAGANAAQVTVWRADGRLVDQWRTGATMNGGEVTLDSPFLVASVSKMVTGIAVLRLVDAGKVDLDRPLVEQWKPNRAPRDKRFATITVRQLLMQTSGVPELNGSFYSSKRGDWRATVDDALAAKLTGAPGARFLYANANYTLLGALIEGVTGKGYPAAVEELVFAPMGITGAVMAGAGELPANAARPGTKNLAVFANLGPAGGWALPAAAAAKLASLRGTDGKPILAEATITAMRTREGPKTPHFYRYGLGVMNYDAQGWGHTGNVPHARAFVRGYDNGYIVVMQTAIESAPSSREIVRRVQAQLDSIRDLPA